MACFSEHISFSSVICIISYALTLNITNKKMLVKKIMLQNRIEEKRQQMIELALIFGFAAKETVKCSQELDQLLNIQLRETLAAQQSQCRKTLFSH
jgi:stage 0 sporulation regulatory protein